jgi:hypothetical protein
MSREIIQKLESWRRFDSVLHGPAHWARVHRFGLALGRGLELNQSAMRCIEVFSWTHDLARVDDGGGRVHALDGADYLYEVAPEVFPALDPQELGVISRAIRHHSDGLTADVAWRQGLLSGCDWKPETVVLVTGCCWDADRLDLLRLGRKPRADKMSTPFWEDVYPLARRLHGM